LRYEIKISEIEAGAIERPIFTQVVDANPLKAVSKAINNTRVRKPKEVVEKDTKKAKLI
jgi:hypothetical protein